MQKVWNLPVTKYLPLSEINEPRDIALVYSNPAKDAVADKLNLTFKWQAEVTEATVSHWDEIGADLIGEVIYAIGGGLTVDAAKYLAVKYNLPLVCLPTAMSVDAFFTWASGYRKDGCVYYMETRPPDEVIIDFDVLTAAPVTIRAAGICDVLSIATGSWDWRYAQEKGKNLSNMQYIPYVDQIAQGILQGMLDAAEAAGRGDHEGIKHMIDCLAMEVQLCNQIGHSRPEEGSEHYFAYSVENTMGKGLPHGDLVGPGILLLAAVQGQDIAPLEAALRACQIPLNNIPEDVIRQTLLSLPEYCEKHGLVYGIAHELTEKHLKYLPSLT